MREFGNNREARFSSHRQPYFWLLPLIIGVALGALLLAPTRGFWTWIDGGPRRDNGHGAIVGYREQWTNSASRLDGPGHAPDGPPRGELHSGGRHGGGAQPNSDFWPFGLFWPFGSARLLVPLLLIGAGAWLLRNGSGGLPGPAATAQQPSQYRTAVQPTPAQTEPQRPDDPEPPATSETRRL